MSIAHDYPRVPCHGQLPRAIGGTCAPSVAPVRQPISIHDCVRPIGERVEHVDVIIPDTGSACHPLDVLGYQTRHAICTVAGDDIPSESQIAQEVPDNAKKWQ